MPPRALDQEVDLKRNPLRWPIVLGLIAGVLGAIIGWLVIRDDVHQREAAHQLAGRLFRFPVSLAFFAAGVTYWITRRVLIGPDLRRDEWTLVFDQVPSIAAVRVGDIKRLLDARGYHLAFLVRQPATGKETPSSDETLLVDREIVIRETRASHGQIVLTMSSTTAEAPAWGSLAVSDTERGTYDELALFLLAALGVLLPGLEHKRTFSNLSADVSATLAEQLPDHPVRLP